MATFLLELKVEEMPAGLQIGGEKSLRTAFEGLLKENNITDVTVSSSSMSSRLVLWAENLPMATAAVSEEKRGPRVDAPEQALAGFLRANGLENTDALEQRDTGKGVFYFLNREVAGCDMRTLLAEKLPTMIQNIPWAKSMRWADGNMTFVRPLSNVLALLDSDVIAFEVDGLASCNTTSGHFFMHPEAFEVTSLTQYKTELNKRKVMLDRDERLDTMRAQLVGTASKIGAELVVDEKLLLEVSGLIEWPYAVLSEVDARFLALPREVLITTMASHQKYFTLADENGLKKEFIGISNMPDDKGYIAEGYRKVLTARFDDAQFYWDQDCKQTLESQCDGLQKVVFQKDLGTVYAKMARVSLLMPALGAAMPQLDVKLAQRAAELAKCDLGSGVISEFPALQGVMGAYYAAKDGEDDKVVEAIRNQYAYQNFAGMGQESLALILADRMDTLVGFFGINQPPTGSKDPYALRRAALSVIRLLMENNMRVSLKALCAKAYELQNDKVKQENVSEKLNDLVAFFEGRLKVLLKEEGIDYDLVDAVLSSSTDDIVDIANRARALQAFMNESDGIALHEAFKRATNITGNETATKIHEELFEAAEKELFNAYKKAKTDIAAFVEKEQYGHAMKALSGLRAPMQGFFDNVMVMVDDAKMRSNRITLLKDTAALFDEVADFNQLSR